uniref:NADH dehydrogenase subunit 5 n=1 Tax=Xestocephalus biprocessus TaxID=3112134 RepID=UPI002E790389|nr:NADH dehydrogenase subunit 5 [Xestocephalus biprocessus]WRK21291.1 NADH dehydrogenase subunit 5 [Xestocephalus biprocessus]
MVSLNLYLCWFFFFFFFSFFCFFSGIYFILNDLTVFLEYKLFSLNSVCVFYLVLLDSKCLFFLFVVLFISSMIILYSIDYMGVSISSFRFLYLMILFVFSMLLMIMSPNLLSIMLGWDGLGLVSYCLVIYFSSVKSYLSGMITCLTNRLGDVGLLISSGWIFSYGSWHFIFYNDLYYYGFFVLIVFSGFTSSAQIPFSCWLPAAMAAPTPVSSLVHSSTLVTAGVYLFIRFFSGLDYFCSFFFFIGLITMFFSSFCAIYEFDLKSVIALSTLSQLGLMMSSLFSGCFDLSFFHLLTHAMFKSLIFLCAGIFIYYMGDNQDIRGMGSLCVYMPFTTSCFNISNMSLCGFPFLSGFYSSDMVVEFYVFGGFNYFSFFVFYLCLGMTVIYSFRLFYYSMIFNMGMISFSSVSEDFGFMSISIFFLTIFSVIFGCMFNWLFSLDLGYIFMPFLVSIMSVVFVFMGFFFGFEFVNYKVYLYGLNYYVFSGFMWFLYSHSFYSYYYFYLLVKAGFCLINWGDYYGGGGFSFYLFSMINYIFFYGVNSFSIFLLSFVIWLIILF